MIKNQEKFVVALIVLTGMVQNKAYINQAQ